MTDPDPDVVAKRLRRRMLPEPQRQALLALVREVGASGAAERLGIGSPGVLVSLGRAEPFSNLRTVARVSRAISRELGVSRGHPAFPAPTCPKRIREDLRRVLVGAVRAHGRYAVGRSLWVAPDTLEKMLAGRQIGRSLVGRVEPAIMARYGPATATTSTTTTITTRTETTTHTTGAPMTAYLSRPAQSILDRAARRVRNLPE